MNLGASGVQIGTRFVATNECDADIRYKNAYVNCTKKDIQIVKSPVGMPGRAIKNKFLEKIASEGEKITKCYNSAYGDIDNGLIFCGSNAYRIDKIVPVSQLIDELIS